jgi:deazaflavin-dependent oxidoreductase (nitroreductase family)
VADQASLIADRQSIFKMHLKDYLDTGGVKGYLVDMSRTKPLSNGSAATLALVLKTIGRKSGKVYLNPLIYAAWADEYVIVGSRGGDDVHPDWYRNLKNMKTVDVQVRDKVFRTSWREPAGEERELIWDYLIRYYPNFEAYQAATERVLPVVILTPQARLNERWSVSE